MPDLTFSEVGEILRLVQQIDGEDVVVQWGDVSVRVQRGGGRPAGRGPAAGPGELAETDAEDSPSASVGTHEPVERNVPSHWVPVTSPMVGTFYRASGPDKAPFVDVGDNVAAGDVVGLVEVMKLFTELTTEVSGRVARIDAANADLVEYGTTVLWVEPT